MSGLAGIYEIDPASETSASESIACMIDRMSIAGESRRDFFSAKGVGLGRHVRDTMNPEPQPVSDRTGRYQAFFAGYIGNSKELWDAIDPEIPGGGARCDARLALAHFLQHGREGVARLNGVFAAAVYDSSENTLTLFTDRYGYHLIYYAWDGRRLVFSSDFDIAAAAAGAEREVDLDAVCDMLIYHFVSGTRTLLKNVNLLPHAAYCTVGPEGLSVDQYWEYPSGVEARRDDLESFVEPTLGMATRAFERLAAKYPKLAVPLSGGLDSRFLAGLAVRNAGEVSTFHVGSAKSKEAGISKRLAEVLGLPWTLLDIRGYDFPELDAAFDRFNDGTVNADMRFFLPMMQRIGADNPRSVTVLGLCLDSLLEPAPYFQFSPDAACGRDGDGLVRAISEGYSQMGGYLGDEIFPPPIAERLRTRRYASIEETLAKFPSGDAWERTRYFYFVNRGRRNVHSGGTLFSCVCDCLFPGLDYDLFDYAVGIPYEYVKLPEARLYRKMIRAFHPGIADVPWDATGLPLDEFPSYRRKRLNSRLVLLKYYLGRISRGALDYSVPITSPDHLFRHDAGFRSSVMDTLRDSRVVSTGIIERRGIDRLVDLERSGRNYIAVIWAILTVEKFLRKVFEN